MIQRHLYLSHVRRGGELVFDQILARAVLAKAAQMRGNTFRLMEMN